MARRRQRFARLMRTLRDNGGEVSGDSRLAKFKRYLQGETKANSYNPLPSSQRKRYSIAVIPFGVTPPGGISSSTGDGKYLTVITNYSYGGMVTRCNLNDAKVGIHKIVGGEEDDENFYPALFKPTFLRGSDAVLNKTSGITGDSYKYRAARAFSIPFGRTVTSVEDAKTGASETVLDNVDEKDVYNSLANQVRGDSTATGLISISYEPELMKTIVNAKTAYSGSVNPASGAVVG